MWENFTSLSVSPFNLVVRGAVVYFAILFLLRISGKREMGQMSPIEFVVILLISNAVQNAMNAGDNSLLGGLILAAVLVGLSWATSELTFKSRKARNIIEGTPTLIVHKGKIIKKNLKAERLTLSEFKILLRKQGVHDLTEIDSAVLEADGSLSLTKVHGKELLS